MKKVITLILLLLTIYGFETKGQTEDPVNNKGAWFVFNPYYQITMEDVLFISEMADMDSLASGKEYHLPGGEPYTVINPNEWKKTMLGILNKVHLNKVTSLKEGLKTGVIIPWDDNIGPVKNYGMDKNGKSFIASSNYQGGDDVRVLIVNGYPVLKVSRPCLNPIEPEVIDTSKVSVNFNPLFPERNISKETGLNTAPVFNVTNNNNVTIKLDSLISAMNRMPLPQPIQIPQPVVVKKKGWLWCLGGLVVGSAITYGAIKLFDKEKKPEIGGPVGVPTHAMVKKGITFNLRF